MLAPFTPPPTTTTSAVWVITILSLLPLIVSALTSSLEASASARTAPSPPPGARGSMLALHHVTRVEGVSQAIPEKVEARHGEGDRNPGKDGDPRRRGEIALGVVEHVTPARERRLDPVAEEADVRLEQDGPRDAERGGHRDDAHRVGEEMAHHDAASGGAQTPRSLHELLLAERQHLASHHAGHVHPRGDADDQGHGGERRRHERGQGQQEKDRRKGQHGISDPEQDAVDGAAEVPGQRADESTERHSDQHGGHASRERDAPGVEKTAQHVASKLVGAEEMALGKRRGKLVSHLDLDRVRQPEAARERRAEPQEGDDDHAGHGWAMAREPREHGRLSHESRTRGSTAAYTRSATRLPITTSSAVSIKRPMSTG